MPNIKINLAGVELDNPITVASGTFGYGNEMAKYMDLSQLGGICLKAVTMEPRIGNKTPRIAEVTGGILNSVGLQNPGVDAFLKYALPMARKYGTKLIANIAGNTPEEFCLVAEKMEDKVDMLELNVSCPNVKVGGAAFGADPKMVELIAAKVKRVAKVPVMVKLSPNVTDIAEIARGAESGGADAVSLINTLVGMKIDVNTRRPIIANNIAGFSGPAVKPVAVRMVWQVANAVKIPILGMGGIMTGEDAVEFILAGATAVSVGTANLVNPDAAIAVKQGLIEYMTKHKIEDINEIKGKVVLN